MEENTTPREVFLHILGMHTFHEPPGQAEIRDVLNTLNDPAQYSRFHETNLNQTGLDLRASVTKEVFILQLVGAIQEIDKTANILSKRLREYAGWWIPERSNELTDHIAFANSIIEPDQYELELQEQPGIGGHLHQKDIEPIKEHANMIILLTKQRNKHEETLTQYMKEVCPNVTAVAGALIGAKLLEHTHSLKRMALLPSSTIQLLGAEKSLFRHLNTGAKSPKHGVIFLHPLIQHSPGPKRGKVARSIADKISIAAKIDYFKGEFIGDTLAKELEQKCA